MSSYGYHLIASSAAAVVARVCTHPLDTIKTRLQVTNEPIHFRTLPDAYAKIIRTSSFSSVYRGLPVALTFSVPALSIYLSCYDFSSLYLDKHTSFSREYSSNHLLSGLAAEVFAGLVFTPMEVLKNQLQTSRRSASTTSLAWKIWREEGLLGFFRGYLMGLAVFVPYTMTYFAVYERLKSYAVRDGYHLPSTSRETIVSQLPFMTYVTCSSIACAIGITISTPLDIVKTRWQISSSEEGRSYKQGPLHIIKDMWRQGGGRAFSRGLLTRICWGIPSTAISMTIYESMKDWYASNR